MTRINLITESLTNGRVIGIREICRREQMWRELLKLGALAVAIIALGCAYLVYLGI